MSLTIVKRPHDLGHPWDDTENSITITNNGGDALVTQASHGLATNDLVYIKSTVSEYNGVWYITVLSASTYEIHEYGAAAAVDYIVDATGVSQHIIDTGSATLPVHLPIVYKIQSDLWPVNGVDTARTVSSFTNYNGYTYLTLSGTLHTGSTVLESVTVVGTSSLDGVYRIINWISASNIVIDLPYNAGNSFSGGTVQYYYMNYHARVRVWAGHDTGPFTALKPMERVAELRCLPDSTGLITVNINEYVKKQIDILANNLLSPTLPFNIDASARFYISVAESYDDSDGYTVSEYVSSFTDDTAATAVNANLPFKTKGVSLSRWIASGVAPQVQYFLSLFTLPVMTPGKYFELSFYVRGDRIVKREIYVNDVKVDEVSTAITFNGYGIYRYSFEQSGHSEDRVDISVYTTGLVLLSEVKTVTIDNNCYEHSIYLTWLNYLGAFEYWNFTGQKTYSVDVEGSRTQEKNIFTNWPNSYGETADTIRQQTQRESRNSIRVESQHLTLSQVEAIKWIVSSPLVQIVTSQYDRRTVIVDSSSLTVRKDGDAADQFTIGFNISYTDPLPSQSL